MCEMKQGVAYDESRQSLPNAWLSVARDVLSHSFIITAKSNALSFQSLAVARQ